MNNLESKIETRGRKKRKLTLPKNRNFTVNQLFTQFQNLGNPITKVTIMNHIKREGLEPVGRKLSKTGRGRHEFVFRLAA